LIRDEHESRARISGTDLVAVVEPGFVNPSATALLIDQMRARGVHAELSVH
jgi:hypothetical protein